MVGLSYSINVNKRGLALKLVLPIVFWMKNILIYSMLVILPISWIPDYMENLLFTEYFICDIVIISQKL